MYVRTDDANETIKKIAADHPAQYIGRLDVYRKYPTPKNIQTLCFLHNLGTLERYVRIIYKTEKGC